MSQDISFHRFKAFPTWHVYYHEGKCAECFHPRAFALHKTPPRAVLETDPTNKEPQS